LRPERMVATAAVGTDLRVNGTVAERETT